MAVVLGACALIPGATLALTASRSSPHPHDAHGRGQLLAVVILISWLNSLADYLS